MGQRSPEALATSSAAGAVAVAVVAADAGAGYAVGDAYCWRTFVREAKVVVSL